MRLLAGQRESGQGPPGRPLRGGLSGEEKISPGGAEELATCFTAHARDLFGYACVVTHGDHALADDLVQAALKPSARPDGRCAI